MQNTETTLRSTILPKLMHRVLWRGTCLAIAGAACLLIPGIIMSPVLMGIWGLPLFLAGMGLITWGLVPYRKLRKLEDNPYKIVISGEDAIQFSAKGKALFTVPREAIEQAAYCENETAYGIAIYLKSPLPKKLTVDDAGFNMADFRERSLKEHGCDLFLPYFSNRSFSTLEEWQRQ